MVNIGGNVTATVQKKTGTKNKIGEGVPTYATVGTVLGWLDYQSGDNTISQYRGKVQDTTHIFLCDYKKWTQAVQEAGVTGENSRLVINGNNYNVLYIDNPMELNEHMELYLQYIGGGING